MPLIIRNAETRDQDSLTVLMFAYIVGFYKKPKPDTSKIHQLIQTLLEHQRGIQFVAEQDGDLVGFATLYFAFSTMRAEEITIMNDLFLYEPYRNTEVEDQLFMHCQHYTQHKGYAYMSWITGTDNQRAQQFFDQKGAVRSEWVNYSFVPPAP
ncbi:GNAT family N-acetyltransferase [Paenibacillus sp. HWE-109]|uniref:GNAT family N-acetyltransferase n=1 Tax=Paenibacillus sp. HWE-109 TaxID=1306526 RepID=UPI001EDCA47A|nr:GNAT family N-acetyltransferase [Paenibacillus sp. HWE-109]UKS30861.1 GNAT family N-acetyltransferase [Paenibacillus sp. HWE-109]